MCIIIKIDLIVIYSWVVENLNQHFAENKLVGI